MARCLFSDTFLGTNRLADAVSVLRSPLQSLENEQVERPLQQLNPILIAILLRHVDILHALGDGQGM